jgi:hypothetical protein
MALALSGGLLALSLAMAAMAARAEPPPLPPLYDCARADPAEQAICRSPELKRSLRMIDGRYAVAGRFGDPDVRVLAAWDRFYFAARLWACDALGSSAMATDCVREQVSLKAQALSGGVTRDRLLEELLRGGSLNAALAQRYPQAFLGRWVKVCGQARLHHTFGGSLSGDFTDCRTGGRYALHMDHPGRADRGLFAGHADVAIWFIGRFEMRHGHLVCEARAGSEAPVASPVTQQAR